MNIFYLNEDAQISAQEQCDKHICKMTIEYCQLLSTAHRVLDGEQYEGRTKANRRIKRWLHPDKDLEEQLYKASHIKHPSGLWCRATTANYEWLYKHFMASCKEYTRRYGKVHATETKLAEVFKNPPKNLPKGKQTEFAVAIAENQTCRQIPGFDKLPVVKKYQQYILNDKPFAKWTNRTAPKWFTK